MGKHLGMFRHAGDDSDHPLHVVEVTDTKRLAVLSLLIARLGRVEAKDAAKVIEA